MRGMSSLYPYTRPSAGHGSTNSPEAEGRPEVPARKKVSGPSPSYVNPYSVDRRFLRIFMLYKLSKHTLMRMVRESSA